MYDKVIVNFIKSNLIRKDGNLNTAILISNKFLTSPEYKEIIKLTNFLPESSTLTEKIYCIMNDISELQRCKCGTILNFNKTLKAGYCGYCSHKCFRRYNTSPLKTCSETRHVNNKLILKELLNLSNFNIKSDYELLTFIDNVGKISVSFDNIDFYKTILLKTSFLPTFNNKYEKNKIKWSERIYCIRNNITEMPKCYCGKPKPFDNSNKGYREYCNNKCRIAHNYKSILSNIKDFEVLNDNNNLKLKNNLITFKCNSCDSIFEKKITNSRWKTLMCEYCYKSNKTSKPQQEIYSFIIDNISHEVLSNNKTILNNLELDIVVPKSNLAIELNGIYWHSESQGKDKNYHLNKTKLCIKKNLKLIHIFDYEWNSKNDICKSLILSKLGKNKKIFARKCKIKEISNKDKDIFLENTHLQGKDKSKIKLGLYFEDELVSVMTFCKSRFNKKYQWELSRFSSKLNTTIVGGASKLFSYFIKTYNPKSIITYANRRYSDGNLYKQLKFKFLRYSKPNYFYTKHGNIMTRHQFQKHKLKDKLEIFHEELSEWENMKLNGYDRIWDCGNGVWVYTNN